MDYGRAIDLGTNSFDAYNQRGDAKRTKGDFDGAIADFDRAIRLQPDDLTAYYNRGLAKSEKGDYEDAIVDFNLAIGSDSDDPRDYYQRAHAKALHGDFSHDEIIADFDRAIALNRDFASAYYNRGIAKSRKGDYDDAIADYDRAIHLDPDLTHAYFSRSVSETLRGDYYEAVADLNQAVILDTDFLLEREPLQSFHDQMEQLERLQAEHDKFVEMADQENKYLERNNAALAQDNEQLRIEKADLEDKVKEMAIALRNMPSVSHISTRRQASTFKKDGVQVRYYRDDQDYAPFFDWRDELDPTVRKSVTGAISRMKEGNLGDHKNLHGSDLYERRLDSGLRIYYAKESATSVLILGGGDKPDQQNDIDTAAARVADWRARHPK